jgi:hypothetical protein
VPGVLGVVARWGRPVAADAEAIAGLAIWFSYWLAPQMNGERSGSDFTKAVQTQVTMDVQRALVAYKEQFLLYLDRPTVNFGHRRWLEGAQELYDASLWLNAAPDRVLLMPKEALEPCFPVTNATLAGRSSDDDWYLVRGQASEECARKGDPARAISYAHTLR